MDEFSDRHRQMQKRNRLLGGSLGVFVILLIVVSYFRIKGLTP
ncbi:hypothetical protein [Eilatimonas milleporae]|uniref:Uncharacterized protein n=1 Tax=Eilatimonas milleporae TaxID=911205 RepID=A0A3M0C480_9PROT|nr:hypothetical protein [Eilatimonas milleporae]RMB04661.1 hypothetical protein BXY39_2932 [Eilatimonas milleporae]